MYNLNGMLANMYLSKDQPMKYFVATMRCDQFDSLDKILTETKVYTRNLLQRKVTFGMLEILAVQNEGYFNSRMFPQNNCAIRWA